MTQRPEQVQTYLAAAKELFTAAAVPPDARKVATDVFARLQSAAPVNLLTGTTGFDACAWLDIVSTPYLGDETAMGRITRAIRVLQPHITWSRREKGANGSTGYQNAHANGMICGPGGIEERDDVHLGFTIMAPGVRYPEHRHPGDEAYVFLTPGEFRMNGEAWFDPGIGGGLHNPPWTEHAMRSGNSPLLTLWCLNL